MPCTLPPASLLAYKEHQRAQYSQKSQEVQSLRAELNRAKIKSVASSLGVPATPPPREMSSTPNPGLTTPPRPQSVSTASAGSRSGATSPTSPTRTTYTPSFPSPLARPPAPSLHARTASLHVGQRSMTPSVRSGTPLVSGADIARPATIPPKTRRMSMSSTPTPTKMARSSSDEKEKEKRRIVDDREKDERRIPVIQRWIPSADALSRSPPTGRPEKFESGLHSTPMRPPIMRYKTPLSNASP